MRLEWLTEKMMATLDARTGLTPFRILPANLSQDKVKYVRPKLPQVCTKICAPFGRPRETDLRWIA